MNIFKKKTKNKIRTESSSIDETDVQHSRDLAYVVTTNETQEIFVAFCTLIHQLCSSHILFSLILHMHILQKFCSA